MSTPQELTEIQHLLLHEVKRLRDGKYWPESLKAYWREHGGEIHNLASLYDLFERWVRQEKNAASILGELLKK